MSNETEQTAGTTHPGVFKLPCTGAAVPPGLAGLTIKITGHMQGREGWATRAQVKRGGAVIGEIVDEGNGGGSWFHSFSNAALTEWHGYDEQMKAIMLAEDGTDFLANEFLTDRLLDEALTRRDFDRKRSPLIRVDGNSDQVTIWKGAWDEELRAYLRKTYAGQKVERWVKGQGWVSV